MAELPCACILHHAWLLASTVHKSRRPVHALHLHGCIAIVHSAVSWVRPAGMDKEQTQSTKVCVQHPAM